LEVLVALDLQAPLAATQFIMQPVVVVVLTTQIIKVVQVAQAVEVQVDNGTQRLPTQHQILDQVAVAL
jgi:hypothetical protein